MIILIIFMINSKENNNKIISINIIVTNINKKIYNYKNINSNN